MRVLIIGPHFEPDTAPTGHVLTELVQGLAARGHRIDVVTSLPWYREHAIAPGWTGRRRRVQETPWGSIRRLHPFPSDREGLVGRAAGFAGFSALASAEVLRCPKPDLVLAMSPPLTLGVAGFVAARRFRVPLVFNVQDIHPDVAAAVGAITKPRLIASLRRLEAWIYDRSAAVTVLSEDLAANVAMKTASRVDVIPNAAAQASVHPQVSAEYRSANDLVGRVVVMYAGNIGWSQPFDLIGEAAQAFENDDVVFVLNGEGSARRGLESRLGSRSNVRFVDFAPAVDRDSVLAAADIQLVMLRPGLASMSVPSKLYGAMAARCPVVAVVDAGTEVDRVLAASQAGLSSDPTNPAAFIANLRRLTGDAAERAAMAANAERFAAHWPTAKDIAERYEALFEDLVSR